MDSVQKFDTVSQYSAFYEHEIRHPLVNIIDLSKATPRYCRRLHLGFYTVFWKQVNCGDLVYGRNHYDYQEGTLVFLAPDQLIGTTNGDFYQPKGQALVFHPDLLEGTSLGRHMNEYSFFSYESREALHLSDEEQQLVLDCLSKIEYELDHAMDKQRNRLIVSSIELFLTYCIRFYDRQFITRTSVHKGIIDQFDRLLVDYFDSEKPKTVGLPSVSYCAEQVNLSANYFGDLVKKQTGQSAQEYIQLKVIDVAKERIVNQSKSMSQIAFELGFKYSQHFSRVFKQHVGYTPNEYRRAVKTLA